MTVIHLGSVMVFAGVATHLGFFNRGEHHLHGNRYLRIFICTLLALFLWLSSQGTPLRQAWSISASLAGYFVAGLFGSLIAYRVFFSPLNRFAGPWWAKISTVSFSLQLRKCDYPQKLQALHQKHGDFVRVGSSDLSIIHPKANAAIYGRGSRCIKSDWYDLNLPMISMQMTRKKTEHDQRRRVWGGAFNDTMTRCYEDRIATYQGQLTDRISQMQGKVVNVTDLFSLYGYDVMGDLAFGSSFKVLQNNEQHWAIKLLHRGLKPLGFMFPTWLFRMLIPIPGAMADFLAFREYCCQQLEEKMKTKVQSPDILSFLLEPWKGKEPTGSELNFLQGDSQLIIVAGSDTTASTLASIYYQLARSPKYIPALRNELTDLITSGATLSNQDLKSLPVLNAVINETMRLHPAAGLLQRKTPPEGLTIGDTFVPGGMTVFCPQWVAGRNEEIYVDASAFRPERWFEGSDMIKESSAYAPFSTGPYGCIGRPLALMNLRTTLAKLIMAFHFDFAEGEDGIAFECDMTTAFTTTPGELWLVFRRRVEWS